MKVRFYFLAKNILEAWFAIVRYSSLTISLFSDGLYQIGYIIVEESGHYDFLIHKSMPSETFVRRH